MIVANIFDFIDGKVALQTGLLSKFGGVWDSVIDRFSDILLFIGLIYLYTTLRSADYVMVASFAMMFALMTSYTRARAESLIAKCKVGFMERPERIVLFMIGAFTNRMAGVLWVILVLSIFSVVDRVILTYRVLEKMPERPALVVRSPLPVRMLWNVFFWTFDRATWQYDVMVISILGFVWLTPASAAPTGIGHRRKQSALRRSRVPHVSWRRLIRSSGIAADSRSSGAGRIALRPTHQPQSALSGTTRCRCSGASASSAGAICQ